MVLGIESLELPPRNPAGFGAGLLSHWKAFGLYHRGTGGLTHGLTFLKGHFGGS